MGNFILKTKKKICSICQKGKDGREKWLSKYGEKPAQQQRTGTNTYGVMEKFLSFFLFLTHEISAHGAFVSFLRASFSGKWTYINITPESQNLTLGAPMERA